ncbi:MAG TPA: ABC transporter substrate-binding protein, partial [Phototrophicaceae bacterium]|nr:ABC transporter substrate-binding protein [Phototrophicaceae bacterium]
KTLTRLFLLTLLIALIGVLSVPVIGQQSEVPAPGTGAPVILPNFGADIATLNPFLSNDGSSGAVIARLYPGFIGIDPETGNFAPNAPGGIVKDWTISDDGLEYTFTLRDDLKWSDGVAVTSADVVYAWDIIVDTTVNLSGSFTSLRDYISAVEAVDDYTVKFTYNSPDCNAIYNAGQLPLAPAHTFQAQFPANADMNEAAFNLTAPVTWGPFTFLDFSPGEQVTLAADTTYPDAQRGAGQVIPEGWIYKNVADQTVQTEQFLAGQITEMGVPSNRQQELKDKVDAGEYLGYETGRGNIRFISFNLADPNNPQPAFDEDGNRIDQGEHKVFADVRVRQALNYAMDFDAINEAAFFGFGVQGATHSTPYAWEWNDTITPYPYDAEKAASLLEEAGWTDTDGDGVRECHGCKYATDIDPSFEGSLLEFELATNAGNTSQEALGTVLQDQWSKVGAKVNFQAIDFGVLVDTLTAQTYDAIMIFWGFGFPTDPDGITGVFADSADIPGSGFNTGSYHNDRVEELLNTARALPGCDQAERKVMYGEVLQILHDESPWIWVGLAKSLLVAQPNLVGWDPRETVARQATWNEDAWVIQP